MQATGGMACRWLGHHRQDAKLARSINMKRLRKVSAAFLALTAARMLHDLLT
ncbi:hypothetical protein D9M69_703430 [compost metagenome]